MNEKASHPREPVIEVAGLKWWRKFDGVEVLKGACAIDVLYLEARQVIAEVLSFLSVALVKPELGEHTSSRNVNYRDALPMYRDFTLRPKCEFFNSSVD